MKTDKLGKHLKTENGKDAVEFDTWSEVGYRIRRNIADNIWWSTVGGGIKDCIWVKLINSAYYDIKESHERN